MMLTLNGLFLHRLGYLPKEGEYIEEFPEFNARIIKTTPSKILNVIIYPKNVENL